MSSSHSPIHSEHNRRQCILSPREDNRPSAMGGTAPAMQSVKPGQQSSEDSRR